MTVQECLEIAIRGRQPRRFFDLQHEFAAGRPVGARRDDEEMGGVREDPGDRSGSRSVTRTGGEQRRDAVGVQRAA